MCKKQFLVRLTLLIVLVGPAALIKAQEPPTVISKKHVVVASEPGRFLCWPANNGIYIWGNEIVVGYEDWLYEADDNGGHSRSKDDPFYNHLARSYDGGETWTTEDPDNYAGDIMATEPCPGDVNFAHPDFALYCTYAGMGEPVSPRGDDWFVSYDRGHTWEGPWLLPTFFDRETLARTDYIVNGPEDCMLFLSVNKSDGDEGVPLLAQTTDGGRTFDFLSWIGPEPPPGRDGGFAIQPAGVRCSDTKLICAIRRYERGRDEAVIKVYSSTDNGESFQFLSDAVDPGGSGNPPAMIRIKDGRLVIAYGHREEPYGIFATVSTDEGQTWSEPIILRDDGRNWDIGYCRTVQRPDGKIVTVYYYTTEQIVVHFIGATIWELESIFLDSDVNQDGVVNFLDFAAVLKAPLR